MSIDCLILNKVIPKIINEWMQKISEGVNKSINYLSGFAVFDYAHL